MAPEGPPLVALAQQGVEAANHVIVANRLAGNRQAEPSIGNRSNDRPINYLPTTLSGTHEVVAHQSP
jgi:hypothetical protein